MMMIHEFEIERASRPIPKGLGVVPQSTPVVCFGEFNTAEVASLGINPSHGEFLGGSGQLLSPEKTRLLSRADVGVADHTALSPAQAEDVVAASRRYFRTNPYLKWFSPMERWILEPLGASYFDGSACHLDLSQWATQPVWKNLAESQRAELLRQDAPFLEQQIEEGRFRLIVLNGKSAISQMMTAGIVELERTNSVKTPSANFEIWEGNRGVTRFIGWNRYLQSAIPDTSRQKLAQFLARY